MEKNLGAHILQSIPMDSIPSKVKSATGENLVLPCTRSQTKDKTPLPAQQQTPDSEPIQTFPTYPDHNKSGYSLREAHGSSNAKRPPSAPEQDKGDWMLRKTVYVSLANTFGNA